MNIGGTVHCFFVQSGTFKNEFIKLGYKAKDYDIQNNFGETDCVTDLFGEIDKAYDILTRQDKTRQDIVRYYRPKSRPYCCLLSLYLFLCYFTDVFLHVLRKLSQAK